MKNVIRKILGVIAKYGGFSVEDIDALPVKIFEMGDVSVQMINFNEFSINVVTKHNGEPIDWNDLDWDDDIVEPLLTEIEFLVDQWEAECHKTEKRIAN